MYQPANERKQPKNTARDYLQTTKNTVTAYLQRKESESLKRHTDNGTCPETLKYRTKAKIRADNDIKKTSSESVKKGGTGNPQSDNTFPSP